MFIIDLIQRGRKMDRHLEKLINLKRDKMEKAFHNNNMELFQLDNVEQLSSFLDDYLKPGITVGVGGSMTLFQAGVIDKLRNSQVHFLDRYQEGLSSQEMQEIFRKSLLADLYITSSNAITMNGCLYNIDGNGNRVAAMIYGPREVLVIVGRNKIFTTEEAAINHIRNVAAPANAMRLNKNTPCTKAGKCLDCKSDDCICSSYVKLSHQSNVDRIKVIVVNEELGY